MRVLTTGCFNIMHAGHVELFKFCHGLGHVIVGINGNSYVGRKYGNKAISLEQRLEVVSSCKYVDEVVVFEEDEPSKLIYMLHPDIYVKGPDYRGKFIPEEIVCKDLDIPIFFCQGSKIQDTSRLLASDKTIIHL